MPIHVIPTSYKFSVWGSFAKYLYARIHRCFERKGGASKVDVIWSDLVRVGRAIVDTARAVNLLLW